MTSSPQTLRSEELQRFSENASQLLLDSGRLKTFLASLGYEAAHTGPAGLRGRCPACQSSCCFIGLNGTYHKIYWKCFDRLCPSNSGKAKLHHNLLGLVRGVVEDGSLATAIKTIADFLGFAGRSFDITNRKYGHATPKPAAPDEEEKDFRP